MTYIGYVSFDASLKIHRSGRFTSTKTSKTGHGGINGFIHHIDRGTDRRNGCEVQHSNPDINPDFTLENESYYKDAEGNWKRTAHSKDMVDAIERRVEYAKKHGARISTKGQNDTVIVRGLVVQLDSEVIAQHEDTWMWDVIDNMEEMFDKDNITGFSVHKDETNVHLHIAFVPCYEKKQDDNTVKCTLSQSHFFRNPQSLAGMHRKIRKNLKDKGYDVEQENKPIEEQLAGYYDKQGNWHQQGLTPDQLKELSNRTFNLQMEEISMKLRQDEIEKLEKAMADMQAAAKAKQQELEDERKLLFSQQTALENDRATVQAQMQALIDEKVAVQKLKAEAEEMLEQAYSTADVCNQILENENNLNGKFLEFLDREGKRTNQKTREYVEFLYKKFQKERKANVSDWQREMLRDRKMRKQDGKTNTDYTDAPNIIDEFGYDSIFEF